jgi:hypothetical protein
VYVYRQATRRNFALEGPWWETVTKHKLLAEVPVVTVFGLADFARHHSYTRQATGNLRQVRTFGSKNRTAGVYEVVCLKKVGARTALAKVPLNEALDIPTAYIWACNISGSDAPGDQSSKITRLNAVNWHFGSVSALLIAVEPRSSLWRSA